MVPSRDWIKTQVDSYGSETHTRAGRLWAHNLSVMLPYATKMIVCCIKLMHKELCLELTKMFKS